MNTMIYPSQEQYGVDNNDIGIDDIVTIEEPDDTSDLMLHLEDAVVYASLPVGTASSAFDNHDLFYHHFDYDPLLYFAEYNKNNPIIDNGNENGNDDDKNDDTNDNDIIMEPAEELQRIRKGSFEKKNTTTSLHYSMESISESDEETEEEEEQYL
mmetsp:Transcript_18819/g.19095  ORF Transcript_18819/g.19095 Transcript_18819/m.19095 type:complete len:155 (-) Transcript_18819:192-656(-)